MTKYPQLLPIGKIHYFIFFYFPDVIKHYLPPRKSLCSANTILESSFSLFIVSLHICCMSVQVNRTCATKVFLRKQFPWEVLPVKCMAFLLISLNLPLSQTMYLVREIPSLKCNNPEATELNSKGALTNEDCHLYPYLKANTSKGRK